MPPVVLRSLVSTLRTAGGREVEHERALAEELKNGRSPHLTHQRAKVERRVARLAPGTVLALGTTRPHAQRSNHSRTHRSDRRRASKTLQIGVKPQFQGVDDKLAPSKNAEHPPVRKVRRKGLIGVRPEPPIELDPFSGARCRPDSLQVGMPLVPIAEGLLNCVALQRLADSQLRPHRSSTTRT